MKIRDTSPAISTGWLICAITKLAGPLSSPRPVPVIKARATSSQGAFLASCSASQSSRTG